VLGKLLHLLAMKRTSVVLLIGLLSGPVGFGANGENAAVKYLRADISLRHAYPVPPDGTTTLEKALQSPLSTADEQLVTAAAEA
jgi:hypothetical protein